jgi:hypothetical protein
MEIKCTVVQGTTLYKFKKIFVSDMVMSKETVLTYGYELALNAFQLFGVSRRYRVPYSKGILRFGSKQCNVQYE